MNRSRWRRNAKNQAQPRFSERSRIKLLMEILEDRLTPAVIGYYDMSLGQGSPSQVASIIASGNTAVQLFNLSAAELSGVNVIDVQNPDNGAYGAEYLSQLATIQSAVAGGKALVIHDRFVDNAESILPGGAGFNIVRDFTDGSNIDVRDNTTLVTNGPGGIVDNTTLDGGNFSSHGFALDSSLPGTAKLILTTGDPTHIVTFAYGFGGGTVIYSSIPLDFYLNSANNFSDIYAPNVLAYAATNPFHIPLPPIAVADTYTTNEDTPLITNALTGVLQNDTDPNGLPLTASLVSNVSHGTLTFHTNGSFTYVPNPNSNNTNNPGPDSFTYRANDGLFFSNTVTVTINVTPVNDPPVANPDGRPPAAGTTLYLVHPSSTLNISAAQGVLINDTDVEVPNEGQSLTAAIIAAPLKASAFNLNANGSFSYTANPGTTGDDQFFYHAFDGFDFSNPARVLIHINTPTLAQNDIFATFPGHAVSGNVLTNDIDHDITNNQPDTLTATLVSPPDPSKGNLVLNPNGTFTFTPSGTFTSGATTFTYKVNDGWEDSNIATVTIYMDRLPVANNDVYNMRFGQSLEIFSPGVLANDTDADLPQAPNPPFFQYLNVSQITQQPAHGTLTWNANGYFLYTPNANFNGGVDTFKYRLNDGLFDGSEGTVTINVQGIPVAQDDAYVTFSRTLNVAQASGVLVNDTSPNANMLTARLVTTTGNGQLTLNPDGSFQYFANAGFTGIDHFTYVASVPDPLNPGQTLDSAPATVSITVYINSAPPIARDDSYTTPLNTALTVAAAGVLANDSDPNGDPLQAFLVAAPRNGTLTLNYDGSFVYTPQNGFQGVDSYTYQASDGRNFSNVATVNITVGTVVTTSNPGRRIIEAQDVGGTVKVFAGETGQALFAIQPYGTSFAGGIRVAVADLNGDGVADIITAPGPTTGAAQRVRVFNGVNGAPLNGTLGTGIFPFGSGYKGGIEVASGDVNGDGTPDIIVGADKATTSPQVRVINGATGANFSNWLGGFSPYTGTAFGGVRVAVGDVNGDGKADVITAPGAGTPTVKVYNAAATTLATGLLRSFTAYTTNVIGGVYLAAGDVDGDGRAEIVTGAAANPNGQVRIFNGTTGTVLRSLTLTGTGLSGPARVALGDINGDGQLDLVVGQAISGGSKARVYDALTLQEMFAGQSLFTYGNGYNQGLFVASLPKLVGVGS